MPATKANLKAATPSMATIEIEKKKTQIRTMASDALAGPGQEHFMDVYLLEMVRLQEAFMDDDQDIS